MAAAHLEDWASLRAPEERRDISNDVCPECGGDGAPHREPSLAAAGVLVCTRGHVWQTAVPDGFKLPTGRP